MPQLEFVEAEEIRAEMSEFWKITRLAWGYISSDWLQLFKIFLFPTLMLAVLWILDNLLKMAGLSLGGASFVLALTILFFIINSIVLFHRNALLGERVSRLLPPIHTANTFMYILDMIVNSLVAGLAVAPFMLLFMFIPSNAFEVMRIDLIFMLILSLNYWIIARLSPVLAGAAIGARLGIKESWKRTQPAALAFAIYVVAFVVILISISILQEYIFFNEILYTIFYLAHLLFSLAVINASYRLYFIDESEAH